ncbi:hypothetical protein EhV343 [Emiliania huxleyi virus 86]|uniref:Uncharacterized protein n=1 Tax=Emiliania huxleyi virus 86 (isolate United Kingdom/English Channel/1999) TaxID=654925 RepID=Q4A2D6_EHV8U|nr:hypothetical protein EhV343 [Emiliania huxleyi virus 86]CAI65770.1 hypothetical protein EhV343 [Emiliania huxleyi virus 86]
MEKGYVYQYTYTHMNTLSPQ